MSALPDGPTTAAISRWAHTPAPPLLADALPVPDEVVAFTRGGDGMVGWGTHASISVTGPDAAAQIARWWRSLSADLAIADEVGVPGSGPIVFASLGFDADDTSVAVVPRTVIGRWRGRTFRTTIDTTIGATVGETVGATVGDPIGSTDGADRADDDTPGRHRAAVPVRPPGPIGWSDDGLSAAGYTAAVAAATARIRSGELAKVVLAHDLWAHAEAPIDHRYPLRRLATDYPTCYCYAVDGLIGASPEMLVRRMGEVVTSRVLAGTAWPDHAGDRVADTLLTSAKDRSEHEFAVRSVAEALADVTTVLTVPGEPRPLTLANLTHLATDIRGVLRADAPDALSLAGMLHPSAAVGGSPTDIAKRVIRELERAPRGRYAAPVGWMNAAGDGEFAIALRCGQISGADVRLLAGCGIVADSDPATETREAQIKMIPMRDALEG